MFGRSEHKNVCIKVIRGRAYLYTWQYRPKSERSPRKNQKYHWKYVGSYGSLKAVEFIKANLSVSEQRILQLEYEQKLEQENNILNNIQKMELREPFKSQKEEIVKNKNNINRKDALIAFNKKLRKIARRKLNNQLK
ncbi:hypothetical protein [Bacillus sp. CGMCC 1.16541]|uniref:hypothetical protein n=1 Tax=Bacillus sp. CGMCC 1.16541 TaxID=2185143 RepID=UPI000D73C5D0|nr:hypothetical protein [Bacillus sp. CGMCC 1.16541]